MIATLPDIGLPIAVTVAAILAIAVIGGLATEVGPWYESLRFPKVRPPNWLFGPAWTLIYILTGSSAVIAWTHAPDERSRIWLIAVFALNAVFNVVWSPLFFKLRRPDWALIELIPFWLSIVALLAVIAPISKTAALLSLPYLCWVTFAGYLNWRIVELNKPFQTHWRSG